MKKAALVMVLYVAMCAHAQSQPANGTEKAGSGGGGVVIKDTRVFSCKEEPNGNYRKCAPGEIPWPVGGVLTIRASSGVCEEHTYSIGAGDVYRSKDGTQQIQLPMPVERSVTFPCDAKGSAV